MREKNEELAELLKFQETINRSYWNQEILTNTFKLEQLSSKLLMKPPTFIEWKGTPHLCLEPGYLSKLLHDNTQLSVVYPNQLQGIL